MNTKFFWKGLCHIPTLLLTEYTEYKITKAEKQIEKYKKIIQENNTRK